MRAGRLIAVVAGLAALGGCADLLDHRDTITQHGGDAQRFNIAVQTIDPWPPASRRNVTGGSGKRIEKVTDRYTNPPDPSAGGGQPVVNVNVQGQGTGSN
ncbi:hypothetical protein HPQ64_12545 [Rhizobiales bacterium]|uniref:hypothetical protein n=1 Tax=Hongsoonwoonella zoysiae TaxID=2821844 RepID=UPI0015611289|nr:hypothetical protein [Hongsoonwoonella zoysiae]NRG18518.1 hypothetical protein [Hongsoonwoonella zoysiae]